LQASLGVVAARVRALTPKSGTNGDVVGLGPGRQAALQNATALSEIVVGTIAQLVIGVAAGSAVVPTLIANAFYLPITSFRRPPKARPNRNR